MEITQDHWAGTITLSQKQYVKKILEKHQMLDAKPVTTPINPNVILLKQTKAPDSWASLSYATAIGSGILRELAKGLNCKWDIKPPANYGVHKWAAAIDMWLDISFPVQTLSQFMQNPRPEHWLAVKKVFKYLQGLTNLGLTYGGARSWPQQILTAYTDANYDLNPND